jgi:CheY-like chemotaxis protein
MGTVLVVDDDAELCRLLETFLGFRGIHVLTAPNGRDALDQLAVVQPSLILLDLTMPVMDGIQFRLHQQQDARLRQIPVVCLSARHDAPQIAERLGLTEFLRKPLDLDAVVDTVRRHCATKAICDTRDGMTRAGGARWAHTSSAGARSDANR